MLQARGTRGRLLAVYAEAALLGAWRWSVGETLGTVTEFEAVALRVHPVLSRYRPLVIALAFGDYEWCWTLRDVQLDDGQLRGSAVGAPVVRQRGA